MSKLNNFKNVLDKEKIKGNYDNFEGFITDLELEVKEINIY